jgi:hypothetical protein
LPCRLAVVAAGPDEQRLQLYGRQFDRIRAFVKARSGPASSRLASRP